MSSKYDYMCEFSCAYGYCPMHLCTYTATGTLLIPLSIDPVIGTLRSSLSLDERNLCLFNAVYNQADDNLCWEPAPTSTPSSTPTPSSMPKPSSTPVHCIDNESDNPIPGNLVCFYSDGSAMTCDECLGLDGNSPAKRSEGSLCFIINTTDKGLTTDQTPTSCPGDPPPAKNPDGTPGSSVGGTIVDAYCSIVAEDGLFGWINFGVCYGYVFAENGGEDYTAGITCKYYPFKLKRNLDYEG